jgi:hypothetical protein
MTEADHLPKIEIETMVTTEGTLEAGFGTFQSLNSKCTLQPVSNLTTHLNPSV